MLAHVELMTRIASGAALGGIIGYERDLHGRPVGLRTHLLVALTSATFMVVSSQFADYQSFTAGAGVEVDASRIAASVVSGIGFLAGGAILRTGATVQGLTTAAGLWLVTAIGLCAGAGMYPEAAFVTLLGVVALTVLRRFEDKNDTLVRRRVSLVLGEESGGVSQVMAALGQLGATVGELECEKHLQGEKRLTVTFEARIPATVSTGHLVEALEVAGGVRSVAVRPVA